MPSQRTDIYDGFLHLCLAIGLERHDWVVMLTAYFDASGTDMQHRRDTFLQPAYVLGGYIARVEQWSTFKEKWQALLDAEDVSMFHAAELESPESTLYAGWTLDRRQHFRREAYSIINEHCLAQISSGIVKRDFNFRFFPQKTGSPGNFCVFCVHDCLKNIRAWVREHSITDRIQYVFEAGDVGRGQVSAVFDELCKDSDIREEDRLVVGGLSFEDKREVVQLQAADAWAYECYKQMVNRHIDGELRNVRKSFAALFRDSDKSFNTFWDKEALSELASNVEEHRPSQRRTEDDSN